MTRQAYSFIEKHGQTITKKDFTSGTEDSWGDTTYSTATATVIALVSRPKVRNDPEVTSAGYTPAGLANVAVKGSVAVNDGAGSKVTEWAIDGKDYSTLKVDEQNNGIKMVQVERKRSE